METGTAVAIGLAPVLAAAFVPHSSAGESMSKRYSTPGGTHFQPVGVYGNAEIAGVADDRFGNNAAIRACNAPSDAVTCEGNPTSTKWTCGTGLRLGCNGGILVEVGFSFTPETLELCAATSGTITVFFY